MLVVGFTCKTINLMLLLKKSSPHEDVSLHYIGGIYCSPNRSIKNSRQLVALFLRIFLPTLDTQSNGIKM